ncbi:MAG: YtxH domain-containing protein [Anaerolineae bacterium]|nr:YtxH domain-containing protein [Anaerolineae bacterium]
MMNSRIYYSQEAEQQAKRQQALAVLIFTAAGVTLGAVFALLFAPRNGEQIRRELSSTFNESADATNDALHRLENDFSKLRQQVEDRVHS